MGEGEGPEEAGGDEEAMTNSKETTSSRGQRPRVPITLADLVAQLKIAEEQGVSRADYAKSLGLSERLLTLLLKMAARNAGLRIEDAKKIFGTH